MPDNMSGGFQPSPPTMSQAPVMGISRSVNTEADALGFDDSGFSETPKAVKSGADALGFDDSGFESPPKATPKKHKAKKAVPSKGTTNDVTTTAYRVTNETVEIGPSLLPRNRNAEYGDLERAEEAARIAQAVARPPAPREMSGIRTGPEFVVEYEDNEALQVELSNPLLRNLSPFTIRVEPPLIYGDQGGFQNKARNTVSTDFSVMSGNSLTGYDRARRALSTSGISGLAYQVGSPEEYVVSNGNGTQKNTTPTGQKADSKGNLEGNIGQPAIADLYTALDIARQLSAAVNTPPLVLLINPTTLSIARTKIQQFQERSRYGYIFQAWGEEQPKLSFTARCGAFVSGGRGVHFASKRDSLAWQNLMNAFHFYRNNGYIYDTVGKSNAHLLVGALSIHYDGWVYFGHMESFSYTYDEEHMHGGIEFSIEFTASAILDTSQQTFSVQPMRSPIPSLSDSRSLGSQGFSEVGGGFAVSSDGNVGAMGDGDAFGVMVPQSGTASSSTTGGSVKPGGTVSMNKGGFQAAPSASTGSREVRVVESGRAEPFRRG